jgi:hypothetical protein
MALVGNAYKSQVLSFPLDSENLPLRVYLKDTDWELNDIEDQQDIDAEDETTRKKLLVERVVSRVMLPDRYKREEIVEAIESMGIRSSLNLYNELSTKPDPMKLLERLKILHKAHIQAFTFGEVNYPKPIFVIVRTQGRLTN